MFGTLTIVNAIFGGVGPTYALRQTGNTRERIEARVETRDLADSILFHN